MFGLGSSLRFYLYAGITDMRKSFDGLCGLVQSKLDRNPISGEVFIFINRRRDRVKLLRWERGGFVLYYKRLEQGTLELPRQINPGQCVEMTWTQLVLMVEGISVEHTRNRPRFTHKKSA